MTGIDRFMPFSDIAHRNDRLARLEPIGFQQMAAAAILSILAHEWIEEAPLNSAAQRGSLDLVHLGLCQRWNGRTLEIH
jgi:hypothetical protein